MSAHYRLFMKIKKVLCALTLVASAHVGAAPILVGEFAPQNSSTATLHEAIRFEIADYNQANPELSLLFGAGTDPSLIGGWNVFLSKTSDTALFGDHTLTYTAPSTFSEYYLFSKYGLGGADFSSALHHLTAGDVLSYNPGGAGSPQGLSDVAIWARGSASIPDSGQTVALLCISMIALVLYRRRLTR